VKSFDGLWAELSAKVAAGAAGSGTVEAADRAAEEIAQLLYHVQVLMLARGIALDDVYAKL
jgi:phosphoribosyl-ATP pyrophosphohydrolase